MASSIKTLIALGSNLSLGALTPRQILRAASTRISQDVGIVLRQSKIYATPAFPPGSGPDFANQALAVDTALSAAEILERLHEIEAEFSRKRVLRWGARTLDLDLIAHGSELRPDAETHQIWRDMPLSEQQKTHPDRLILPHPRLQERAFVLVPLAEIAPDWVHPALQKTLRYLRDALPAEELAQVVPMTPSEPEPRQGDRG